MGKKQQTPSASKSRASSLSSPQSRLSLCMIVKDEERFLSACLESVRGLVDEAIIVDTGSSDKTKEIARGFVDQIGGKLLDFVWADNFSAARNESLKYATGDWILVLDADEVIAHRDH
ncbi:TPA: glycosyltransferase family 2 protein, partial [Candidatus Woesearchaeota archaeon]|nr:glycosyltransferase family 2 protein [Candidatus Woesearchaeota archaeon]